MRLFMNDDNGSIGHSNSGANNEFNRLNGEWARSTDFQRNTVRAWALYQLPWGLAISGAYFYGSGNFYVDTVSGDPYGKPGTNRLNLGASITTPASLLDHWNGPAVIATGAIAAERVAGHPAPQSRPPPPGTDQGQRQGAHQAHW